MNGTISSYTEPPVQGFLHIPERASGDALVLTHGAGGNANSPLLIKIGSECAGAGLRVLRINLPFRQGRPQGPPRGSGAADRENIRTAVRQMREMAGGRLLMGGVSYGGRQSSMLAAEDPRCADGLVLLSYPLHPPGTTTLRNQHFPSLHIPVLFVQGSRDPFGKPEELEFEAKKIPAPAMLSAVANAGHDLKGGSFDIEKLLIQPLLLLLTKLSSP